MNVHRLAGRSFGLCVALTMAGAMTAAVPGIAAASTCVSWTGTPPANPSSSGDVFQAVTVRSPCDVLAVGYQQSGVVTHTLAERWNGLTWTTMPSASPGGSSGDSTLAGVAATSPTTAWAVGYYSNGTANQTLIETLVGTVWEQESSANPGGTAHDNFLNAVAATSARNAWAVGDYSTSGTNLRTLIEHWNGATWSQVPSPSPGSRMNELLGVTATSAKNAWAVGSYANSHDASQTLIEHWNGTVWKRVPSPDPGGSASNNSLGAVAASSATNAWAVGTYFTSHGVEVPLAERWNGSTWKPVPTPSLRTAVGGSLDGVTVLSARDAWAAGNYVSSGSHTLTEHWNGSAWIRVPSPDLGTIDSLLGVAASAPSTVWTVGTYDTGGPDQTLAFHCC